MEGKKAVLIEGYGKEEFLGLLKEQTGLVFTNKPIVFKIGSAEVLGKFSVKENRLIIELAHIDGGGEGVLSTIAYVSKQYARHHNLVFIEWIIHATNCANPNAKLLRVLERRGFLIQNIFGFGLVYYLLEPL